MLSQKGHNQKKKEPQEKYNRKTKQPKKKNVAFLSVCLEATEGEGHQCACLHASEHTKHTGRSFLQTPSVVGILREKSM